MRRRHWLWITAPLLATIILGTLGYNFLANYGQADTTLLVGKIKAPDPLPIRQVVLFNSGVGYFQREGEVDGNARIQLSFPVDDINDLLKSLVLQDAKGQVGAVHYDSSDPIDKILRSFALDLTMNPTFGQILNQARGEKIDIARSEHKDGKTSKISGTIIGLESHRKEIGKDQIIEAEVLNLNTTAGLQAIPMDQIVTVRFLNPVLESEFQRALTVLATAHDTQKKTVSVGFNGEGKRQVRVGYVVERPIWKTTYRLRLDPKGKIFLQGWALVENTSDDDWNDVRMVLVSGKPISFKMNLYDPIYIPRPFVEPAMFASLRPPVYGGAIMPQGNAGMVGMVGMAGAAGMIGAGPPADPTVVRPNQMGMQMGMQMGGMPIGGMQMGMQMGGQMGMPGMQQGGFGQGLNQFQQQSLINLTRDMQERAWRDQNKLGYDELQRRRAEALAKLEEAKDKGSAITGFNFKEGIQSVATAAEIGDYYQYAIDQKISLPRQKSAMLPILDQNIEGHKVSIFNETVHAKYPLLGLKLKNTSGQPLTQGPITVYDGNVFSGDTRILDVQPNEERLLSYALDQGTEVKTQTKQAPSPDLNFRIGSDNLSAKYDLRQTKTYTIKNRSTHDRVVLLEHPLRTGWTLIEPKKPLEQTRNLYRFQVAVPAGKTVSLDVIEDMPRVDNHAIGAQPSYAVANGINVKVETQQVQHQLVGLKIIKGYVQATYRIRETKAYFVQNLSDMDRSFTFDHMVRPGWVRLDDQNDGHKGPAVFRFKLDIAKGKTGQQAIREEFIQASDAGFLKQLPETTLREFLISNAASADVKAAFTKTLDFQSRIAETQGQIARLDQQLKVVTGDHTRVRDNLNVVPMTSEHYKMFLEKFVAQDRQIETLQTNIRQLQGTLQSQQRDQDQYLAKLDAE